MNTHTFSVENTINQSTSKAFGSKYAGTFSIRRPSLLDKKNIALRDAASMSAAGDLELSLVNDGTRLVSYIFSFVETVAEQSLPEWFNMATMYEPEDEDAVLAVWAEVGRWMDTFRSKTVGEICQPGGNQPSLLVQE